MNSKTKIIFSVFFLLCISFKVTNAQKVNADSVKHLLCSKSWHLMKLTDINKGSSMGGELFNIDTKFNLDGTIETTTAGKLTNDNWKLNETEMTIETNQLKDPKTAQEKIKIIQISSTALTVQITYRGNNIMQYDYQ